MIRGLGPIAGSHADHGRGDSAMLAYVGKWQGEHDAAYADVGDLLTAIRSAAASSGSG